jgi:hypothetical protein
LHHQAHSGEGFGRMSPAIAAYTAGRWRGFLSRFPHHRESFLAFRPRS